MLYYAKAILHFNNFCTKPCIFLGQPLDRHMHNDTRFPQCRNTLESYFVELQKLAMTLLGVMREALKMEKREMEEMFENGMQSMRMNYYPPCPKPELVVGLRPHSDATGLTVLLQVNGVDGLEVKKDGVWLPVKFQPDSFVVNVGDTLEVRTFVCLSQL